MFPTGSHANLGFVIIAPQVEASAALPAVDAPPDLSYYTYTGQFFPRWTYHLRKSTMRCLSATKARSLTGSAR